MSTREKFGTILRSFRARFVAAAIAQLKKSRDPVLSKMATKIIAAQNKEIAELDRWIATHDRAKPLPNAH